MRAALKSGAALAACLVLAGCGDAELYTGLTEHEANEMIAVIDQAGMHATKSTKDGKAWTLLAPGSEFSSAVALLEAQGYPRERFESLGDVFKKDGFVSSPVDEHARLIYGLSQELSNTLSSMDGVVYAHVHIALPQDDPLADAQKPSSAAIFIKYDPQVDLESQVASIKSLVVNSIEGLQYDHVSVVLSPAREANLTTRPPARGPGLSGRLASFGGVFGAGLGALALGVWLRRLTGRDRSSRA